MSAAPPGSVRFHFLLHFVTSPQIPVIRIFGSDSNGNKSCVHIHGVFPYLYIPYHGTSTKECDRFTYQVATSLDKAINISLGQMNANVEHVFRIVHVKGMYDTALGLFSYKILFNVFYLPVQSILWLSCWRTSIPKNLFVQSGTRPTCRHPFPKWRHSRKNLSTARITRSVCSAISHRLQFVRHEFFVHTVRTGSLSKVSTM